MATQAASEPRRMTLDEWAALDEDETDELVDGLLVEAEVTGYLHELVVAWLCGALGAWGQRNGAIVAASGAKFAVAPRRGRMPDLTVFLRGARRPPLEGLVRVPPSIAIEIVTPTPRDVRRDRVEKLGEYAAFGVPWYWLVDPELRTFEILELGTDGRYAHAIAATEGAIDPVPGCEGLRLDVDSLWAQIDQLAEEGAPGPDAP